MCNFQGATADGNNVPPAHFSVSLWEYGAVSFVWLNMWGYTLTNSLLTATAAIYLWKAVLWFFV